VAEIKIPDNTKFHKNISIMITPATLPSQRCAEWLLLAEHGCCWRNMAAVLFAPLPIHTGGCRVFIFFSQPFFLTNVRGYGVTPSEHVWTWFCNPFADAHLLAWWVKSAHLFRLTAGLLVHT